MEHAELCGRRCFAERRLAARGVSGQSDGAAQPARSVRDEMALRLVWRYEAASRTYERCHFASHMCSRDIVPRATRLQVQSGKGVSRDTQSPESSKSRQGM